MDTWASSMLACVISAFSKSEPSSVALKRIADEVSDRTAHKGCTVASECSNDQEIACSK